MALKSGRVGIHPSLVDPITGMLLSSPSGASSMEDLTDVNISSPESGQTLIYDADSEKWVNEYSSIAPTTLATLPDVDITSAQNKQVLQYNSSSEKWENENLPEDEGVPIGTIISFMGISAPQKYLACDGTAYNISAYPELASFIESQFSIKNYFGGDGTTTFAVPDLRGEFLRGTGTNTHEKSGSGDSVGIHQAGTIVPYSSIGITSQNVIQPSFRVSGDAVAGTDYNAITNPDYRIAGTTNAKYAYATTGTIGTSNDKNYQYVTRPTNTSILYCIKAK